MMPLIVILGPTCVGKTAVALELAALLNAEIISADSRQIYKGMDIGTAKVSLEEQKLLPHHLINLVNPDESFTLADYVIKAEAAIKEIQSRGRVPLMVGGTGLYIRAFTEGYAIPMAPPDHLLREELNKEAGDLGPLVLHKKLLGVDPEAAGKLHPNDFRRISRALEVFRSTGVPISEWQKRRRRSLENGTDNEFDVIKFGLTMDRDKLYGKINARLEEQIHDGLLEEVRHLLAQGYAPSLPAFKTFGYQELIDYLEGKYLFEKGIELVKRNTRRFAKRQWTWFRRESNVEWIEVTDAMPLSKIAKIVFLNIKKVLGR